MIEFPEAVRIIEQMNKELIGKKITRVAMDNYDGLVKQGFMKLSPEEYEKRILGKEITKIHNLGKYFFINLEPSEYTFMFGFETSGKVLYHKDHQSLPKKFTIKFIFDDKSMLTIRIIAWGFIHVEPDEFYINHKYIQMNGITPLDNKLTFTYFNELLEKHNKSIKTFFVGQKYIAGIGNGYLQSILFKAKIHPKRKIFDLSNDEKKQLYNAMRDVMNEAIPLGGRNTEVDLYGKEGEYLSLIGNHMKDKPCPNCGTKIEKQHVDGSSAYVCPSCQMVKK